MDNFSSSDKNELMMMILMMMNDDDLRLPIETNQKIPQHILLKLIYKKRKGLLLLNVSF